MTPASPIILNTPRHGIAWPRFIQTMVNFILFFVIASIAIPSCLGYRINWAAGTIQQTGLIELSGPENGLPFHIFINNVEQQGTFPFRLNWVFPGSYTLRISAPGYQEWEKDVVVEKNRRTSFRTLLLVYKIPHPITVPNNLTIPELDDHKESTSGIEISNGNQLFVDGEYVTSTSQDIVSARWYTDRAHVVYQSGKELVMYDLASDTTQSLMTFNTTQPVSYMFTDGGRILVYSDKLQIKAVDLYDPISFIDRLEAVR